jgi:Adenylate and Guanylate cyclase catalytic domain
VQSDRLLPVSAFGNSDNYSFPFRMVRYTTMIGFQLRCQERRLNAIPAIAVYCQMRTLFQNRKYLSFPPFEFPLCEELTTKTISFASENPDVFLEAQAFVEYNKNYVAPDEDPYEPVMDIYYPIIDDISRADLFESADDTVKNNTLVGALAATVYWRNIIQDTLPPGSNGLVVVFNNTCSKSFTYQINGPDVVFRGVNDKHDVKYDNLRISSKITELEDFSFTASVYSGAPISEEFCPYSLHLYPTDEMRSDFTTNNGAIYAGLTLFVIGSLGIIFVMYDFKVERRQKKVLSSAIRSSEIVSSLFPSSVQDQLYPIHINNNALTQEDISDARPVVGGPIAKLYHETTVMFADIKGFTQWSADRQPTEVFHLLETLYGAFDALARRYGVFKVETIGDTYVAVVGLPNSRKEHAIVMVRFAKKCLAKMAELTRDLEASLGPVRNTIAY